MCLQPTGTAEAHRRAADLPELLPEGALVVVNDTRVLPARLLGRKPSGGRVEILLVRHLAVRPQPVDGKTASLDVWSALGRANRPLKAGARVEVGERGGGRNGEAILVVHVLGRGADGLLEVGLEARAGRSIDAAIRACGHVPLPPYIRRQDESADVDRYQTVYARGDGAVAEPTAGVHRSPGR